MTLLSDGSARPARTRQAPKRPRRRPTGLAAHVGRRVTVRGIAMSFAAGALLVLQDGTAIVMEGLHSWPRTDQFRAVRATGRLIRRPAPPHGDRHRHGPRPAYELERASWVLLD
jgi:hypothetical protein